MRYHEAKFVGLQGTSYIPQTVGSLRHKQAAYYEPAEIRNTDATLGIWSQDLWLTAFRSDVSVYPAAACTG
jgi:hypothetical protein